MKKNKLYLVGIRCYCILISTMVVAQDNVAIVLKDNFYGVVSSKGTSIIPSKFKAIKCIAPNQYAVENEKGLWGFYVGGKKTSDCLYDNFRFENNSIIAQKESRWGVLNTNGVAIIDFRYKYINSISETQFKVGLFNQWCIRNFKNELLSTLEFDSISYLGENVYKFCLVGKYGLVDQNGKIITTEYQTIYESTLGTKYPKKEFTKLLPVLPKGNFKIPLEDRFDTVYHFSEGFAKFQSDKKFGFVDSLGNIRLVPQYKDARHFSEGMVGVVLMGKWGFMDKNERLCIQPLYDEVSDFKNGISIVKKEQQSNIVNKHGTLLYGENFDQIIPTYSGNYLLLRTKKIGLADSTGHELISTKYEDVAELGNSFIVAKEHGLWGIFNKDGNIVIPFNYSAIQYDPEHNRIITMEPGGEKTKGVTF